jgi:hypothetical protein
MKLAMRGRPYGEPGPACFGDVASDPDSLQRWLEETSLHPVIVEAIAMVLNKRRYPLESRTVVEGCTLASMRLSPLYKPRVE